MRSYLTKNSRVFVNNIIVTLSPEARILPEKKESKTNRNSVHQVCIQIPNAYDSIGIIDGQHRVLCYHEGTDTAETVISKLRKQQTLLVTGIIYPEFTPDAERRLFEANLFYEINKNQTSIDPALRQEIELLIRPYSTTSMAKKIIKGITNKGPYKGFFQTNFFDSEDKIKTSSIVSYGLRPLVKMSGTDSLFSIWPYNSKIKDKNGDIIPSEMENYIKFCIDTINEYMLAAKLAYGTGGWALSIKDSSPLLRTTVINGLINALRKVIEANLSLDFEYHKSKLTKLKDINFNQYKSSQWRRLGTEIFDTCYNVSQPGD